MSVLLVVVAVLIFEFVMRKMGRVRHDRMTAGKGFFRLQELVDIG